MLSMRLTQRRFRLFTVLTSWGIALAAAIWVLPTAQAEFQASVDTIIPSAEDVSGVLPPLPKRLAPYAWQGTPGTDYTITFSVSQEPAVVIGVGAEIRETSFSSSEALLTVRVSYNGSAILTDDSLEFPSQTFMIILDPGISSNTVRVSQPGKLPLATDDTRECYGPGRAPSNSTNTNGDFGDDDGLADPPQPRPEDTTVGLPADAPGSWISTNSFYWCYIPPSSGDFDLGFKSRGPSGATDKVQFYLSDRYKSFLTSRSTETLNARELALFSNDLQTSIAVQDVSNGLLISAELDYIEGSTNLTSSTSIAITNALMRRKSSPPRALAATIESLISRSFSLGLREEISIAPDTIKPSGSPIGFFGFVSDPELTGALVQIIRLQKRQCISTQASSATGVVIARTTVSASGSYRTRVPNSTVFAGGTRRSTVAARITRGSVQQSREVTLSNRSRNNRG
jgi:hypothetical protein